MFAPAVNVFSVPQQQPQPSAVNQVNLVAAAIQNLQQMIVLQQAQQFLAAQSAVGAFAENSQPFAGLVPQPQHSYRPSPTFPNVIPEQNWANVVPLPSIPPRSRFAGKPKQVPAANRDRRRQPQPSSVRKRKRSDYDERSNSKERLPFDNCLQKNLPAVIVLDTNELILNLDRISSLSAFDYFTLIVPMTVINELDNLKMNSRDQTLRIKAQTAISYLYSQQQSSPSSWIKLQTREQVYNNPHGGATASYKENNDDRILDCALYQKEILKVDMILLTEDKNMSLKARCNSLMTMSVDQLFANLTSTSPKRTKLFN